MTAKYDSEKKEQRIALLNKEKEKQIAVAAADNRRKNTIIWSVALCLFLAIALGGYILRTLRITQKQKLLIENKNRETELQKKIIEEKNKDITDSINYAKNIQHAILPFENRISESLNHFVLFKPRDIVSGDFYWFTEKENYIFLAVADCTGHGVPGAFMSMIGSAVLTHAVSERNIIEPGKILSEANRKIKEALKQTETSNRDGMDISLIRFDKMNRNQILYAGAMRSLYHVSSDLHEIKGDKMAIGGTTNDDYEYHSNTVSVEQGDLLYIMSDGYADQFGGPDGKKFRTGKLKDVLISIKDQPMPIQKSFLDEMFERWRGDLEQIDDVCLVGIKV
jgi:serine phosphatase RsbU (regulator of sigma subunit)